MCANSLEIFVIDKGERTYYNRSEKCGYMREGCVKVMEKKSAFWRTFAIAVAVIAMLAAVLAVLYRLDKRMRRLLCVLDHKLTPQKNVDFRVDF